MTLPATNGRDRRRVRLAGLFPDRALQWQDYADAWLTFPLGKVLDYGCGTGAFLHRIADRWTEAWGVDIDAEKISQATPAAGATFLVVQAGEPLPLSDGSIDTVILMEVIEHVADEGGLLVELSRVLAVGGKLLLTTPHRGWLTFLDPGNVKFVAPALHRFIHCTVLRRKEYYEHRFGDRRRASVGMIADFTTDQRPWHRHYGYRQIRTLAPDCLRTVAWAVYFPAFRAIWSLRLAAGVLTAGWVTDLPRPIRWLNRRLSRCETLAGDQLVVLFEKIG